LLKATSSMANKIDPSAASAVLLKSASSIGICFRRNVCGSAEA
jgi:hypothetical protein